MEGWKDGNKEIDYKCFFLARCCGVSIEPGGGQKK
jgi:hypothetical protein